MERTSVPTCSWAVSTLRLSEAVGVVLRAGFVTTLITNASVAQQLLKQNPVSCIEA